MQIVIDISERAYAHVKEHGLRDIWGIDAAISNGVVLPDGHGKIVDVEMLKAVLPVYVFREVSGQFCKITDIDNAPSSVTLIDADKEVDE